MTMRRLMPILMLLAVTGCSFFSRSQSRVYSLDRIPATAPAAGAQGLPVAIDSLELPPGLDRREIVVRKADRQLEVRSNELWQASLQPAVLHTLAFDLAGRLPEGMVILPGQVRPAGAIRGIDVVIEEILAGPEPAVLLECRWMLRQPGGATTTHRERISVPISALDSANVATGTSQALAALADRIAAGIR